MNTTARYRSWSRLRGLSLQRSVAVAKVDETAATCASVTRRNGEFMPLCRTPRHEAASGASTVPYALTMTAADVTTAAAARAQARNRATVWQAHSR
jgi:hypothetical protein